MPCSMPSTPPAPGLFSTITCEPSDSVSRCAMKRAMKSEPPPGAKGTTMRTGVGACAVSALGRFQAACFMQRLSPFDRGRLAPGRFFQCADLETPLERERVLSGLGLAAQVLHRARDAPARPLGRHERLRLAQHHQILEGKLQGAARPAPWRDEA